jgi:hypothetical protein
VRQLLADPALRSQLTALAAAADDMGVLARVADALQASQALRQFRDVALAATTIGPNPTASTVRDGAPPPLPEDS